MILVLIIFSEDSFVSYNESILNDLDNLPRLKFDEGV